MDTITVCNAALARLGEARIFDLSDDSAAGRACALNFPLACDEVLRSHWWNFATIRTELVELTEAPAFGYAHAYQLPLDCLRVLEVNGVSGTGDPSAQWEIENGRLLHDDGSVNIRFIRRVTDLNYFDSLALEALIILLASKLAPAIQGGSTGKAAEFLEEYHRILAPIARRVDGNESRRSRENQMDAMLAGSRAVRARVNGQGSTVNGG
jgi:hypothetical protein